MKIRNARYKLKLQDKIHNYLFIVYSMAETKQYRIARCKLRIHKIKSQKHEI